MEIFPKANHFSAVHLRILHFQGCEACVWSVLLDSVNVVDFIFLVNVNCFFLKKLQFSFFSFLLKNGGSLYSIKFKQKFLSLDRYALFNANMLIIFTLYFKQKNSNFLFLFIPSSFLLLN